MTGMSSLSFKSTGVRVLTYTARILLTVAVACCGVQVEVQTMKDFYSTLETQGAHF